MLSPCTEVVKLQAPLCRQSTVLELLGVRLTEAFKLPSRGCVSVTSTEGGLTAAAEARSARQGKKKQNATYANHAQIIIASVLTQGLEGSDRGLLLAAVPGAEDGLN